MNGSGFSRTCRCRITLRRMRFQTTIHQIGNNTGILVPEAVLEELGGTKRPAVVVTVGSLTYRSTVGKRGPDFLIALSAENRKRSGVAGGDLVDVEIELDAAPREVPVPGDLAELFAEDPGLAQRFEALSYSNRKRLAMAVETAKTPETRRRRVDKVVEELRESVAAR
jgi:antitoxin component of MazEF toxin-antitoxin module